MSSKHPSDDSLFFDSALDLLVTGLFVFEGLGGLLVGFAGTQAVDRQFAREIVADMETQSTVVSEPVLVDTIYNLAFWGSAGVAVVGALYLVASPAFRRYRRRTRQAGGDLASTRHAVALGGSLAILLSFVPFATVGGGAVAGYLRAGRNATAAGTLAGAVSAAPALVVAAFAAGGAVTAGAGAVAAVLTIAALLLVGVFVAFGAVGGFFAGLFGQ